MFQMGADKTGVYFVHKKSVSKYDLTSGERVWNRDVTSATHVAIQNGAMVSHFDKSFYLTCIYSVKSG